MIPTKDVHTWTVASKLPQELTFRGYIIGSSSSQRPEHLAHRFEYAEPKVTCGACRWTEVTIYARTQSPKRSSRQANGDFAVWEDDPGYVVLSIGQTIVPNERLFHAVHDLSGPFEVIEVLTIRPPGGEPWLPPAHARAIAQAVSLDNRLRDAYVNRAVI